MKETKTPGLIMAVVSERIKTIGDVNTITVDVPLCVQGFDSLDDVQLAMELEGALEIRNMVVTGEDTPEEVAANAWRIFKRTHCDD